MTEKDLSRYYWLSKEAKDLENRLIEFGDGVKSMQLKEVSVSSSHSNTSIQEKKLELESLWMKKRLDALEEYIKIERYMDSIEDVEIRAIMRARFMDLKNWEQIGEELNSDRTTVSKKLRRYLKQKKES